MKKIIQLLLLSALFAGCIETKKSDESDAWGNARWIAFEQLRDSMKVVPAVHGSGDHLGDRAIKRSVVPLFRKEFNIADDIENASINISGLGHYELYINGDRVGDRFLSPGWTYYQKRCFYNTYDITEHLKSGDNAIGVIVGNGFYNINRERYRKLVIAYGYPELIFNITVESSDGSVKNYVSDQTCRVSPSPITYSSIYGGEDYDAGLEQAGWNIPGFDDSEWQEPFINSGSRGKLMPEEDHPLKVMQEFKVQNVFTSETGRTIYDFGQNASGIISLKVKGNRGARIVIRPDEILNSEGNITQRSSGGPFEFNYVLRGEGLEEWQPRFTYYGFRYADVEIIESEDASGKTEIVELKMLHTRNSSPAAGSFSCSDTLFNQIFDLINWGIKSNMASVATDCPHREKLGWLEQVYLIGPSMHYNFNIHKLYRKIVVDMMDSQLDNGLVPDIAPEYVPFEHGFRDSPEWGSASVIIPWQLYKWYGDIEVLEKAYPMMKRYVEYLESQADNGILDYGLGDWYDLGPEDPGYAQLTPKAVTATSIYYYDLQILSKVAQVLGNDQDIDKYNDLSVSVKDAFLEKFYKSETGLCATGSQTSYAMPLYTGIIPEEEQEKVLNNLIDSIKSNDFALTSGDIGYHFLVRVLSQNGRSDILYKMNNRTDRPGYGYQLKMGATALTESWSALAESSNNHMMLGHLMEWFYAGLGGIYQETGSVAYREIILAPKPVGEIKWVKCSFRSPNGIISTDWKIEGDTFLLKAVIPEDASAKIIIPENYGNDSIEVREVNSQEPVDVIITDGAFRLASGTYEILTK